MRTLLGGCFNMRPLLRRCFEYACIIRMAFLIYAHYMKVFEYAHILGVRYNMCALLSGRFHMPASLRVCFNTRAL
jgi:hypothetical protein